MAASSGRTITIYGTLCREAADFHAAQYPEQRLDFSPLVPHLLSGKTAAQIERIELQTTRVRVEVAEFFGCGWAMPSKFASKVQASASTASARR